MTTQELEQQIKRINDTLSKLVTLLTPEVKPCSYTLFSWLDEWLETYKRPKLKENSFKILENCIRNHIKPNILDKPLNAITGLDIQKALNRMELSRTKKYTYYAYSGTFKQAVKLKIIHENPMNSVEPVVYKYTNGRALTSEEHRQFLELIQTNKFRYIYEFYLLSGCRRNEAVYLQWTDIDFANKRIHIRGTKTESSNRYIPLFPEIEELLKKLPETSKNVFGITVNALNCNFKRMKAKYQFTFRLHDLRHTFATRCYENGISLKIIQKWLGHSKIDVTSNIYTHVTTDFEREEILKFKPKEYGKTDPF